ncbi:MAG: LamG-like jellyroll fold domain-containing protein [Candidatus Cryptobacteroides sp.]
MKKILVALAAALMIFGCQEKPAPAPEVKDSIEIEPSNKTISAEGGDVKVMVTSSGEWTLEAKADYKWVSASADKGVDGDIVTFKVDANETLENLVAEWDFICGEAVAPFKLTLKGLDKLPASIKLNSEGNVVLDYNQGEFTVLLHSDDIEYRDIKVTLGSENSWLTHVTSLAGDEEGDARIIFSYKALEGLDDLRETITFSGDDVKTPVVVNVLQEAKHVLSTEKQFYTVAVEGETVEIPVTVNVEYSLTVSAEGNGWLTAEKTGTGIKVTATALKDGKRSATITLAQTDAKEGEDPLEVVLTVTQVNALITWAADMTGNRLFPKWDGTAEKLGYASAVTLEALINVDEFNNNGISTVMGIEGDFLLRFGDSSPDNVLQVATMNGNYEVDFEFENNRWYHLAVTFTQDASYYANVEVYIDGVKKGEKLNWQMKGGGTWWGDPVRQGVNFSKDWSYEPDGTRCFWMGYSYDANRDLKGRMTEIRIWNKALTEAEINAPDHFYTVDPKSEGLYSYWKFTAGEGSTIEDATGNGNKLYGETDVRKQGSDNIGDAGIKWVEVALPDK